MKLLCPKVKLSKFLFHSNHIEMHQNLITSFKNRNVWRVQLQVPETVRLQVWMQVWMRLRVRIHSCKYRQWWNSNNHIHRKRRYNKDMHMQRRREPQVRMLPRMHLRVQRWQSHMPLQRMQQNLRMLLQELNEIATATNRLNQPH